MLHYNKGTFKTFLKSNILSSASVYVWLEEWYFSQTTSNAKK